MLSASRVPVGVYFGYERIFGYCMVVCATMLGLTIRKLVIADSTLVLTIVIYGG